MRTHLAIRVDRTGDTAVLTVTGDLDTVTAPSLTDVVTALLDAGARHVALDLDQVVFLGPRGLDALVAIHQRSIALGVSVSVTGPHRAIPRLLHPTGVTTHSTVRVAPAA